MIFDWQCGCVFIPKMLHGQVGISKAKLQNTTYSNCLLWRCFISQIFSKPALPFSSDYGYLLLQWLYFCNIWRSQLNQLNLNTETYCYRWHFLLQLCRCYVLFQLRSWHFLLPSGRWQFLFGNCCFNYAGNTFCSSYTDKTFSYSVCHFDTCYLFSNITINTKTLENAFGSFCHKLQNNFVFLGQNNYIG